MITTLYLIIFMSWFFAGIPLNIIGFVLGYKELKKRKSDNERFAIKIAMVVNILFIIIGLVYL